MKKITSLWCLVFFVSLPFSEAWASQSVNVDVKIESEADYKGSSTKPQSRILKTTISNYGKDAVPDVKVKWWTFGHNMKGHELIILKEGESKVGVPASGKIEVASQEGKVSGTREHKVTSRKGGGRRGRASIKTAPASGQKSYGYAVEVYSDNTQIAAEYSQPSLKKELHPEKDEHLPTYQTNEIKKTYEIITLISP